MHSSQDTEHGGKDLTQTWLCYSVYKTTPEGTFTFEVLSKGSTGFSDFWKASPSNPVHVFLQRGLSTTNALY